MQLFEKRDDGIYSSSTEVTQKGHNYWEQSLRKMRLIATMNLVLKNIAFSLMKTLTKFIFNAKPVLGKTFRFRTVEKYFAATFLRCKTL